MITESRQGKLGPQVTQDTENNVHLAFSEISVHNLHLR